MNQRQAQIKITKNLKRECLGDLSEETRLSYTTLLRWRDDPPESPSLRVFVKLCNHYTIPIGVWELEGLV
jgi:hypothetical protein